MDLHPDYLLFLGGEKEALLAKTARGVLDWRPEICAGQLRLEEDAVDLGLPDLTPEEAAARGARSLVVGIANPGGRWSAEWITVFERALEAGLDLVSGLHERLNDNERLRAKAAETGRRLIDLREPPADLPVGTGKPRAGRRLLTVGTDCAVGKKYAALAIWKAFREAGAKADFRATGQTGLLISGGGFAIDAVISDFLSGAAETLSPANEPDHWDVVEGQGSLFHPAYAGVSLGLLHGAQPEAIVVCHQPGRASIKFFEGYPTPSIEEAMARNLELAKLTSPKVYCAGVSLNTSGMEADEAARIIAETSDRLGLPVIDPIRTGGEAIVRALL